ncbi:WDr90 protein, putative [Ichthyophthirius multifiliis]|uniref:WDr90 protein, putative n=1 Tax=Ichthyophthirius multifiliis TaxID=5932 RepID=G0QYL5_ICHMU|nr:WDr90 protein, putative [Ichthyophthirius multifiliis]EGR29689.1 WDr90 protein, putative [Ichthyophthirius multifiliis]|eukprot:XP_004030925.1 WDr90 protein, putative [Ichthyophthirius multifiliis]
MFLKYIKYSILLKKLKKETYQKLMQKKKTQTKNKKKKNNDIGRRILIINGTTQNSNYIQIPDPQQGIQSLGLLGRYVYLEFLPFEGKYFIIHLDFNIKGMLNTYRLTISNMFDKYKVIENNVLQIPYPQNAPLKWTIMVLDIQYHLQSLELQKLNQQEFIHILKQVQICSTLSFRGLFTADICYSISNLPKELDFKPIKNRQWSGQYQIVYYPTEIDPEFQNQQEEEKIQQKENKNSNKENLQKSPYSQKSPIKNKAEELEQIVSKLDSAQNTIPQKNYLVENLVKKNAIFQKEENSENQLRPYPICNLSHTIGFSANSCKDIKWSKSQDLPDEIIYTSGSLLISSDTKTPKQRFFQGHTSPICSLDVSKDGKMLVSAQQGKKAVVRIWDYLSGDCITGFQCPYTNLKCVSLSYDSKLLATVGTDELNRDLIIIWNIVDIQNKKNRNYLPNKQVNLTLYHQNILQRKLTNLFLVERKISVFGEQKINTYPVNLQYQTIMPEIIFFQFQISNFHMTILPQ